MVVKAKRLNKIASAPSTKISCILFYYILHVGLGKLLRFYADTTHKSIFRAIVIGEYEDRKRDTDKVRY